MHACKKGLCNLPHTHGCSIVMYIILCAAHALASLKKINNDDDNDNFFLSISSARGVQEFVIKWSGNIFICFSPVYMLGFFLYIPIAMFMNRFYLITFIGLILLLLLLLLSVTSIKNCIKLCFNAFIYVQQQCCNNNLTKMHFFLV